MARHGEARSGKARRSITGEKICSAQGSAWQRSVGQGVARHGKARAIPTLTIETGMK